MEKPTPKFKVGDTIYFRSNWFAGSYIPDMMTVFGVRVVEEDGEWHVKYRKKCMRWEIDFNVGDTVWGYLNKAHGSSYLPEKYVISEVLEGDDRLIYCVRGHGTLMVSEANLHPTYKAALMDSINDIIRDTKGCLYAIEKTCERLNIEFKNHLLLPNS